MGRIQPVLLRWLAIGGLLLVAPLACSGRSGCPTSPVAPDCTRVLFLGNSYTSVNDLPSVFADLAAAGGHRTEVGLQATGGATLADHVASAAVARRLTATHWDIVVLQEQSQVPAVEGVRRSRMYPAARSLVRMVRGAGARPMFFLTWARHDGWPENGFADYRRMQAAVDDGYLAIAAEQHAALAPVGVAWSALAGSEPSPGLWQADGSHPTTKGTYLAACVFYAAIFGVTPEGLDYVDGLPAAEAATLQQVAAETVLDHPERWGLR